jgi:hypothetical protein
MERARVVVNAESSAGMARHDTCNTGRFLTPDRPVWFYNVTAQVGLLAVPLSPTKLFIAANDEKIFEKMRRSKPLDMVFRVKTTLLWRGLDGSYGRKIDCRNNSSGR